MNALPSLVQTSRYQLWLFKDGHRTNGGVFSVSSQGQARIVVSAPRSPLSLDAFGVTIEPSRWQPGTHRKQGPGRESATIALRSSQASYGRCSTPLQHLKSQGWNTEQWIIAIHMTDAQSQSAVAAEYLGGIEEIPIAVRGDIVVGKCHKHDLAGIH